MLGKKINKFPMIAQAYKFALDFTDIFSIDGKQTGAEETPEVQERVQKRNRIAGIAFGLAILYLQILE